MSLKLIKSHTNHRLAHDRAIIHSSNTRNVFYILQNVKNTWAGVNSFRTFFVKNLCCDVMKVTHEGATHSGGMPCSTAR
jgi:hypothetical protein